MLHLHHLENSRSFRILWLLEELDLDYQLTCYQRTKSYLAPESLEHIHPMGKAPILVTEGKALIESGFIIEYLLKHFDKNQSFKPTEDNESAWENYTFWMHFSEASAMPPLVMRLVLNKVVEKSPMLVKPISKGIQKQVESSMISDNIKKVMTLMEQHLQHNHWFAGETFSAADIQMHFVVAAATSRVAMDQVRNANVLNWLKRCEARPAFKRAEEKGGRLNF